MYPYSLIINGHIWIHSVADSLVPFSYIFFQSILINLFDMIRFNRRDIYYGTIDGM